MLISVQASILKLKAESVGYNVAGLSYTHILDHECEVGLKKS
jgi:hypothetical protein